ncbi:hypothetical protein [Caballeronia sp. LZ035]|uniref:hypothetical protein n=1 Tax=Caballeronia sp. LZ035 TaxID=3038568 RepID=UPI002855CCED|nr:hypothetical protein [Caballeronia sp. LZ035]MDR5756986.1 hypothetical protein [Caballeronia sp. LZ035]
MKRTLLAAAAALLATSAHATILMYTQNDAGGTIQFSDMPCTKIEGIPQLSSREGLTSVIIDGSGSAVGFGCYTYAEPNIVVTWQNGQQRWYNPAGLSITAAGKKLFQSASKASY